MAQIKEISSFDLSSITDAALRTIQSVQRETLEDIDFDPAGAFEVATVGDRAKPLRAIDLVAERNATRQLHRRLKQYGLLVLGEESLRDETLDLSGEDRLVVLMDMIDGTDLLERRLSNWCSAMVFYYPPQKLIVAAFVGLPNEGIYYATKDSCRPVKYRYRGTPSEVCVTGPSKVRTIGDSSIAFYGQKEDRFFSVAGNSGFLTYMKNLRREYSRQGKEWKTRIYNLGGNPMAMRLIDGLVRMDAVFDLGGQAPHDIVPGAFIAQRAGASLCDLEGNPINLSSVLQRPADPGSRVRYILSSTEALSRELRQALVATPSTEACGKKLKAQRVVNGNFDTITSQPCLQRWVPATNPLRVAVQTFAEASAASQLKDKAPIEPDTEEYAYVLGNSS